MEIHSRMQSSGEGVGYFTSMVEPDLKYFTVATLL